mgnify:CR=1 FL=1|jgi:hypothetical protein
MKKNKSNVVNICLALLLLLKALLLPVICSAEQMYQITETELTELEQNSNRQLAISSQLAVELQTAREQLIVSDQELTEAKLQKELLQKQLTELETLSKNQENLQKEILKSLPPYAPGVLREIGLKIAVDKYVRGASYGVSRLVGMGRYIGLRAEYDWLDKQAGLWVTCAY